MDDQKESKENSKDDELYNLSPSNENEFNYFKSHNLLPFTKAFLLADTAYLFSVGNSDKDIKKANTGSCAIVCHLDEIENKTDKIMDRWITTSWVGDCRAIIGSKTNDNKWKCIELTCDHQINLNYKEKQRLLNEHPNESDIIHRNRVKGRLQPTRVFGDGHYKYMKFFIEWKNRLRYIDSGTGWNPPYVTAKPDISCYKLDNKHDKFMIISTDGLFQDLQNQQIIQYVGNIIDGKEDNLNCNNMSTLLIRQALLEAGKYLDGNLQNDDLNISSVLNLNKRIKRNVHDDLTVIVIFFNEDDTISDINIAKNKGQETKIPKTLQKLFAQNTSSKL